MEPDAVLLLGVQLAQVGRRRLLDKVAQVVLVAALGALALFSAMAFLGYRKKDALGRTCERVAMWLVVCVGCGTIAGTELLAEVLPPPFFGSACRSFDERKSFRDV